MGPCASAPSPGHHFATARHFILGHGGLAHGLERKRGGNERPDPAAPRPSGQSATGIFRARQGFSQAWDQKQPDKPQLYETLARLYKDKYNDHAHASEYYAKAAALPGAMSYVKRFAAYELSYCEGREREAYERLRQLYDMSKNERLPTLIKRLKFLEEKLGVPPEERIPDPQR